jgi:hypothetical protein
MTYWTGPSVKVATVDFASKAHAYFVEHPDAHTFTVGELAFGELFAVRWAFDRKDPTQTWSVLVFEIGSTPVLVEEF